MPALVRSESRAGLQKWVVSHAHGTEGEELAWPSSSVQGTMRSFVSSPPMRGERSCSSRNAMQMTAERRRPDSARCKGPRGSGFQLQRRRRASVLAVVTLPRHLLQGLKSSLSSLLFGIQNARCITGGLKGSVGTPGQKGQCGCLVREMHSAHAPRDSSVIWHTSGLGEQSSLQSPDTPTST